MTIAAPQTGHLTFLPAWSFLATRTWPQAHTSGWEPIGMRMALPFAGTRVRIFSRDFGSTAQTTLNVAVHEGQACSLPTASAGMLIIAPQLQRTEPAEALDSFFSSPITARTVYTPPLVHI